MAMRLVTGVCFFLLALSTASYAQVGGSAAPSTSAANGVATTPGSKLSEYNELSNLDGIPTTGTLHGEPARDPARYRNTLGDAQAGITGPGAPGTTVP
jgi:hypothetical protein